MSKRQLLFWLTTTIILWQCSSKVSSPTSSSLTDTTSNTNTGIAKDTTSTKPLPKDTTHQIIPKLDTISKKDSISKIDSVGNNPCLKQKCIDSSTIHTLDSVAIQNRIKVLSDSIVGLAMNFINNTPLDANHLRNWVEVGSDSEGFEYSVSRFGLFRRLYIKVQKRYNKVTFTKKLSGIVSQDFPLDDYPTIGLTGPGAEIALSLRAELSGPVMLGNGGKNGTFNFEQLKEMKYTGSSTTIPPLWDSTCKAWKSLPLLTESSHLWDDSTILDLQKVKSGIPLNEDSTWDSTLIFSGPIIFPTGIKKHNRIFVNGKITIGTGTELQDCQVVATEVEITGNAILMGGLVFSSGNMTITENPSLGGQFLAQDSMRISIQSKLKGYPLFYVEGKYGNQNSYGMMNVEQAEGEALILMDGHAPGKYFQYQATFKLGANTDLQGLVYTGVPIDPRGRFRGSIIADHLEFVLGPTVYVGFLAYANLSLAPVGLTLPFPSVLPGKKMNLKMKMEWE